MVDFPTVGLKVDLLEVIAAQREYAKLQDAIQGVADQGSRTEQELKARMRGNVDDLRFRTAMTKQEGEQQIAYDKANLQARMANTKAGIAQEEAGFRYLQDMKTRYWLDVQREAERGAAAEAKAVAAGIAQQEAAQVAFRARMATQRAAQDAAETKSAITVAGALAAGLARANGALDEHSGHVMNTRASYEAFVLVHEALSGRISRMPGSLMVLGNAFMGVEGSAGLLGAILSPLGLALSATAIAITGLAVASEQGAQSQAHLQNSLELTGHFAGANADAIMAAADNIAASTHTSAVGAEQAFQAMVASGHVGAGALDIVGEAAVRLSELSGVSATKIAEQWSRMADDPVRLMGELQNQYHFLTDEQYRHIKALADEGEKTQAVQSLFGDFDKSLSEQTRQFGFLEGAIHGAHQALDEFWHLLMQAGRQAAPSVNIALANSQIAGLSAMYPAANRPADVQAQIDAYTKTRNDAQAKLDADAGKARAAQMHQDTITADQELETRLSSLKDNHQRVLEEEKRYRDQAAAILRDPTASAEARANAKFSLAHTGLLDAQIAHKYDSEHVPGPHPHPSTAAADAIATVTQAVADLHAQIDAVSADPFAELSAKIIKAGNDAALAMSQKKNGDAYMEQARSLAQQKEMETQVLQLSEAEAKRTRGLRDRMAATQVSIATDQQANQIMLDFWQSGNRSAADYATAQERVRQVQLDAANAQSMLSIAQQDGVTTIGQIAAHYIAALGPQVQITDAVRKNAQALQDQAQAEYNVAIALNAANQEAQRAKEIEATRLNVAKQVADTNALAEATRQGAVALALYNQQQAIRALQDRGLGAGEATDAVNSQATAREALRLSQAAEANRLAAESSSHRQEEATAAAILSASIAHIDTNTKEITAADRERLQINANIQAHLEQQIKDTAALEGTIKDSIEKAFVDSGKLDFSSLKDGVLKALRKSIYDAFLAKPIDILVNAAVQWEQKALNSLFDSLKNGQNPLASLFGRGGGGPQTIDDAIQQFSSGSSALGNVAGSLGKITSQIAGIAGPLAAAFAIDTMIGQGIAGIAGALGANSAQQKNAQTGGTFGGVLGSIIGLFVGTGTQDAQTQALLNPAGGLAQSPYGKHATPDTITGVTNIASGISQLIGQLGQLGINAQGVIGAIETHVLGPDKFWVNPAGAYVTSANDSASVTAMITKTLLQYAKIQDPQEKALVDQLVAANATLDQISTSLTAYMAAQTAVTDIHTALLKYSDPAGAAEAVLRQQQIARRQTITQDINAGYLTAAQIAQIAHDLPLLEKHEIQGALANITTAAGGAAHSLQEFVDAQKKVIDFVQSLNVGSLSALSPQAQLNSANALFQTQLALARGGNYDSLTSLPGTAQTYLSQAQKYLGSGSAYAQVFQSVQDALTAIGTSTLGNGSNPQIDAINAASTALQDAINAGSLNIVGAIAASNDNFLSGATNPYGSLTQTQVNQIVQAIAAGAEASGTLTADAIVALETAVLKNLQTQQAIAGGIAA